MSQQIDFYQNNLRYLPSLGDFLEGAGTGIPQGFGAGALATANGLLTLDKSLFNDFTGTTAQIAKGLVAWVSGQAPKNTEQDVQRFLYLLQGNEIASFRLETKIATELALTMIPAGRVSAVGKVEELAKGAQGAAEVGAATKGSTGVPSLTSTKGPYSDGPFGEYPSGPVNFNGQAVEGVGDFSSGLGAKGPATNLLSGETKVVGDGAPAANDASFTGAKDLTTNLSEVWTLRPTQRGVDIESYLAKTEYSPQSGWYNVGAERNGYFPLVDFQNGNTLVSLKSVDTVGSTWLSRMQDHIIDLGTNGAKVNGLPANMVLDLRVQPGGSAAAKSLVEFGREYNVKVVVKEFK
ncbi:MULTISPECIES: hypothetical protein [Pseudomonas]|uniref:Uncharacterized protein n=2 Tax=Pseudomonas TaxID=286 RepID=A0A0W0H521_PSEFL|nr:MULTISPECIES: hypothetical protein [Pseudomonas]KTB55901.1 hypothetical protein AO063_29410 [Pseudomonas fluorescens ICMP 11288]RMQ86694.1 hypothetical protein ALP97_02536 [Pseudomonas salomonii]